MKYFTAAVWGASLFLFVSCSPTTTTTSVPDSAEPSPSYPTTQAAQTSSAPPTAANRAQAVPTPHPAAGATQAALRAFPDLAKKDSMFNRAFRDLFEDRRKNNLTSLTKPDWPLELAKETAAMLSIASTPIPTPGTIAAATPSWLKDRMGKPSALDMPAYDQRRALYPRSYYYYYDASGQRFYVDRYGNRHSY